MRQSLVFDDWQNQVKITRAIIHNYRNLKDIDVKLDKLVALVGENNSGKSNFLKAISLPFSPEDGRGGKSLSWFDINNDAKGDYYSFIAQHVDAILNNQVTVEELKPVIPTVTVTVELGCEDNENYDVKDLLSRDDERDFVPRISYRWSVKDPSALLDRIKTLLTPAAEVSSMHMSLLPTELFRYEIIVPDGDCSRRVPYDVLSRFKYALLPAERDNFAASSNKLGSQALINLLRNKMDPIGQRDIERGYGDFLDIIRKSAKLDEVINWQEYTDTPGAQEFFREISVLPNMPPMSSILGSIRLGYDDETLATQGLGNRNLILMAVMLNSFLTDTGDISLKVIGLEEPEAHLCINNVLLMASLFKTFERNGTQTQLIYTTHDSELINKIGLSHVVVLHHGTALNLADELNHEQLDYLSRNPNTDIFKMLFSHRLVLVEGLTEELLIKSYLQTRPELTDIKVLAFHKGYQDIIRIWKKINCGNDNKLGIIRDFDNQEKAKDDHDALADRQVCVTTTNNYTLESDIVATGSNYALLLERYGSRYGWIDMNPDELQEAWREHHKADVMMDICHDLIDGILPTFALPSHIQEVLDFLQKPLAPLAPDKEAVDED